MDGSEVGCRATTYRSTTPLHFTGCLYWARTVYFGLLLDCLTASLVAGSHVHKDRAVTHQAEASAKSAPVASGLGAQFASRHVSHNQSNKSSDDDSAPVKLTANHSTTHVHEVPFVAFQMATAAERGYRSICLMSSRCSQATDIFHPPRLG